ncbi:hypothetical protein [Streptomyces cyaneofuscatus]|uniref:hypothetical protein n=1 Tax=Streptomyces cyaneofuscatus TaxID=66883 RepID=UPI0033B00CEE
MLIRPHKRNYPDEVGPEGIVSFKPLGREAARQAALSLAASAGPFLVALLEWWTRTH